MKTSIVTLFLLLTLQLVPVTAQGYAWDGKTAPPLTSRVYDGAALFSDTQIQELQTISADLEAASTVQLVFVTVSSLGGRTIEELGLFLGREWGIGYQDTDNGILVIAAMDEHRLRVEVGYGMEGTITDLVAGRIVDNIITPRFKEGNFFQGFSDAGRAISSLITTDPAGMEEFRSRIDENGSSVEQKSQSTKESIMGFVFIISLFFMFGGFSRFFKGFKQGKNDKSEKKPSYGLPILIGVVLSLFFWRGLVGSGGGSILMSLLFGGILTLFQSALMVTIVTALTGLGRSVGNTRSSNWWSGSSSHSGGGFSSGGFSGGGGSFGGGGASGGW